MGVRLGVIGAGYLGATQAACLAELGHDVVAADVDAAKVKALDAGVLPFFEPRLADLLYRHTSSGRLRFTTDLTELADHADVHFVCVGTPAATGRSRCGHESRLLRRRGPRAPPDPGDARGGKVHGARRHRRAAGRAL